MTTYQETHKSHWKPSWRMLPRRVRSASSARMARSSFCNPMQHRSRLLMCRVLTCISIPCRLSTSSTPDGVSNSEYHRAILLNRGSAGCILLTLNPVKNLSCQGTPVGCKASQPVPPGADNCYNNAFAESGFGTLKAELEMTRYDSVETARKEIGEFLAYYNLERKHSSLDYQSPNQFELRQTRSRENPDRRK